MLPTADRRPRKQQTQQQTTDRRQNAYMHKAGRVADTGHHEPPRKSCTPSLNRKTAPRTTDRTRRTNRRPSPDQRERRQNAGPIPERRTDCNLHTVTKAEDAGTIPGNAAQLQNLNEDPRKQHSRRRKQNSRQPTDISTRTALYSPITPYLVHRAILRRMWLYIPPRTSAA